MNVKCIGNDISFLKSDLVRKRIQRWVNSEGQYVDLEIESNYTVQAVEYLDNGIWYYIHTTEISEHPYPYAAECFVIEDSLMPTNWEVSFRVENGRKKLKRITFKEWAEDDLFYEMLVDENQEYVSVYLENRIKMEESG